MAEFTGGKTFDRRGFLKGSALFAASAVGLAVLAGPAFAQDPAQNKPAEEPKKPAEEEKKDAAKQPETQSAQKDAQKDPNKLYDKSGREYRVCERCGGNMYQEEKTWTCEQCGLSYTE